MQPISSFRTQVTEGLKDIVSDLKKEGGNGPDTVAPCYFVQFCYTVGGQEHKEERVVDDLIHQVWAQRLLNAPKEKILPPKERPTAPLPDRSPLLDRSPLVFPTPACSSPEEIPLPPPRYTMPVPQEFPCAPPNKTSELHPEAPRELTANELTIKHMHDLPEASWPPALKNLTPEVEREVYRYYSAYFDCIPHKQCALLALELGTRALCTETPHCHSLLEGLTQHFIKKGIPLPPQELPCAPPDGTLELYPKALRGLTVKELTIEYMHDLREASWPPALQNLTPEVYRGVYRHYPAYCERTPRICALWALEVGKRDLCAETTHCHSLLEGLTQLFIEEAPQRLDHIAKVEKIVLECLASIEKKHAQQGLLECTGISVRLGPSPVNQ